jgi:hypothetical protein
MRRLFLALEAIRAVLYCRACGKARRPPDSQRRIHHERAIARRNATLQGLFALVAIH